MHCIGVFQNRLQKLCALKKPTAPNLTSVNNTPIGLYKTKAEKPAGEENSNLEPVEHFMQQVRRLLPYLARIITQYLSHTNTHKFI